MRLSNTLPSGSPRRSNRSSTGSDATPLAAQLLRPLGIPLVGEGAMMLLCLVPSLHFADGTWRSILLSGLLTLCVGCLLLLSFPRLQGRADRRAPYLIVTLVWVVLTFFGTLPFLSTGSVTHWSDAIFESCSGISSCGGTVIANVEALPPSVLLWRSMTQWIGGFGIVLMVLAIVPTLGISKYALYAAEASAADNTSGRSTRVGTTIRRTLTVYVALTLIFVVLLLHSGMHLWDAVNLVFTNISSGGFSIYNDSLQSVTHAQQFILAGAMFCSGLNFTLLFYVLSFRFRQIRHKLDQFSFYLTTTLVASLAVAVALHGQMGYPWVDALRCATVQTISVITTSGSLVADTSLWWTPILFFFVILSLCGAMAGSTSGGLKSMRVLILLRNVRNSLRNRLHPSAVNPVRLNGQPVSSEMLNNVMVIFFVFLFVSIVGVLLLMLSGVNATEAFGACIACITGYGPGLGASGGFGCYADFTTAAKWIASLLMILGLLECLTVLILFTRNFWRH